MAEEKLSVVIDTKAETAALRKYTTEINTLQRQMNQLDRCTLQNQTSFQNLSTKLSMLNAQYTTQGKKLTTYKNQLNQAQQGMAKCSQKLQELGQRTSENAKEWDEAERGLRQYGEQANKAKANIGLLEAQMEQVAEAIRTTQAQMNNFSLLKLGEQFQRAGDKLTAFGEKMQIVGQGMTSAGTTLLGAGTVITTFSYKAIQAYTDYESAFTGVRKTVDATEEQFAELSNTFREMSLVMPESASSIAEVAEVAGQLGIKVESVEKFTEVMVKMGDSTNLSATEAAEAFAKFMNVMGNTDTSTAEYQDKVERLASTVVKLGNNTATTEADIMAMAQRLGAAGAQVGMSEAEVAALSATLSSLGLEAEAGGSAFSKLMVNMQVACETGGEDLENFAKICGVSAEEFKQSFGQDAYGAIDMFIKGLASGNEMGESAIKMLDDMGINEIRLRDAILRTTNAQDLMNNNLQIANSGWSENSALTEEAEKRYETLSSRLEMLKNKFTDAGIKLGEALVPALEDLMEGASKLVDWFSNLSEETQTGIVKFGLYAVAGGTVLTVLGKLTTSAGAVVKGFGTLTSGAGKLFTKLAGISSTASAAGTAIQGIGAGTTVASSSLTGLGTVAGTTTGTVATLGSSIATFCSALLPVAAVVATAAAGIYAYHEYNEAMNESILKTTEEMSWLEEGFRKLNGVQAYSREELEEMGLVYKDFNENISEDFRDAVNNMTEDIHDFGMSINDFSLDGVITDDEVNQLQSRVSEALKNCITAIDERGSEIQEGLTNAFNMDGVIDESEKSLLEYWNGRTGKEKEEAQKCQDEINNIINTARAEGRALRPEEEEQIRQYYARIKQIELECMADNSYEIEYAQHEFQNRINTLDAEGSIKLLEQRHDQYEEQNIQTKSNYDTLIALAKEGYNDLSAEEKAYVDDTVRRLEEARDQELAVNKQKYDEDIKYAEEHCENLGLVWNKYRAEKVAAEDVANYQEYEQMREHYEGIENITKSGYQQVYDTATGTWKDIYVSIDETTGELKGVYDLNSGNLIAMTQEDESALNDERRAWQGTTEGIIADMKVQGYQIDELGNIYSKNTGEIIGSIVEVEDENGNLTQTITDVNGNPIAIKDNCGEVINELESTKTSIDNLDGKSATISVTTHYYEVTHQGLFSNTQKGYGYKNGQAGYYGEQGTHGALGSEQLYYINEKTRKSRGWELVDGPYAFLGSDSIGDRVLLGQGAAVTNNLTSTAMMMKAVQDEVASSINKLDFSSYSTPNSRKSRALQGTTIIKSPVVDMSRMSSDISDLKYTLASLLNVLINTVEDKDSNLYVDGRKITSSLAPYMDIELQRRKNRR